LYLVISAANVSTRPLIEIDNIAVGRQRIQLLGLLFTPCMPVLCCWTRQWSVSFDRWVSSWRLSSLGRGSVCS